MYVVSQNGRVVSTKQFLFIRNYPELAGGAQVVVPQKEEKKVKEKVDGAALIAYSTAFASVTSIIIAILKY